MTATTLTLAERVGLSESVGLSSLTWDQVLIVTEALEDAVWAAQEARAEEFRAQMFGDSRHPDFWETVRLFTTTHGRRAHVVGTAHISNRYDGVRVGDPFVASACSMVWAFADDVSLDVDGVPICERCARSLNEARR